MKSLISKIKKNTIKSLSHIFDQTEDRISRLEYKVDVLKHSHEDKEKNTEV
jgi:hypothetical protein